MWERTKRAASYFNKDLHLLLHTYLVQQRNQQTWVVHRRTARKILADERDHLVCCRVALAHTSNLLIVFLPEAYFLRISSVYMNHLCSTILISWICIQSYTKIVSREKN